MKPRHYLHLPGARTLQTRFLRLTERSVGDVARSLAMGIVHGNAGLGKTYAVEHASLQQDGIELAWFNFPLRTTTKDLVTKLLTLVTKVSQSGTRSRLEPELLEALSRSRWLIRIDEAQHLNYECVEYLRHLHDDPDTTFGLLLVGGNNCWELLSRYPMLESRFYRRVEFRALAPIEVINLIPRFHPLYENAPPDLIEFIDQHWGHGNLRDWAAFTLSALELMEEHRLSDLTERIARSVFTLLGGVSDS